MGWLKDAAKVLAILGEIKPLLEALVWFVKQMMEIYRRVEEIWEGSGSGGGGVVKSAPSGKVVNASSVAKAEMFDGMAAPVLEEVLKRPPTEKELQVVREVTHTVMTRKWEGGRKP